MVWSLPGLSVLLLGQQVSQLQTSMHQVSLRTRKRKYSPKVYDEGGAYPTHTPNPKHTTEFPAAAGPLAA